LIFGTTGSGKSTLANALINGADCLQRNANGQIDITDILKD